VAVLEATSYVTVPLTGVPPEVRRIVDPLIVEAVIASLNVTVGATVLAIPVAPLAGFEDETRGGVVSGAGAVAKIDETGDASMLPARSVIPEMLIV